MTALMLDRYARQAPWRRAIYLGLTIATAGTGTGLMAKALSTNGLTVAEAMILVVFGVSFIWISLSFWSACFGALLLALRRHPVTLRPLEHAAPQPVALHARTALLMPVYNEDTARVFAGLLATWRSLEATGAADRFDMHLLSDTRDPEVARAEEDAWADGCRRLGLQGRLFYRRRAVNSGRKAGNIAEWIGRCGDRYGFMVILDADSVMSGETLLALVAAMEANPRTGIIQTLAIAANRQSTFARALQFAGRLYGPMLGFGSSFWQLGEANYYGHNAIIRVSAFADHCHLPVLSGRPPLGGEILSHDFVEAALIRRGGWYVWLCPELSGSFEELPPNVVDYAVRDRRWTQGNLQHARLIGMRGLHWMSRLHLGMGIVAFLASPFWLLLLVLSSGVVIHQSIAGFPYFSETRTLFPAWPEYAPGETVTLLLLTAGVLFVPKLLGLGAALVRRRTRRSFGGARRLLAGSLAELLFSALLAPMMMMFHTAFVSRVLLGASVGWNTQSRDERGVSWPEALRRHGMHSAIGLAWTVAIGWLAPGFLVWIAPVALGLVLSVPLCVLSSRRPLGIRLGRMGLFVTPEEIDRPEELRRLTATDAGQQPIVVRRDLNVAAS
jgi:membrane glycosyltransferase